MLRKPVTNTARRVALVLPAIALIGYWFSTVQRDWSFVGAAETGNISGVRAGLDKGIDPNKAQMKGATALRMAIVSRKRESSDIVRLLLDRGADPNDGLYLAVGTQQVGIVQMLIARGANVNPTLCCGDGSLLLYAAQTKNTKIIHLLKSAGAKK